MWWGEIRGDETFRALRDAASVFVSPAEIEAFGNAAAEAWRPLEGLIDHAMGYGLALLAA